MGGVFKNVVTIYIFLNVDTEDGTISQDWGVGVDIRAEIKRMRKYLG